MLSNLEKDNIKTDHKRSKVSGYGLESTGTKYIVSLRNFVDGDEFCVP
jgi:hypothetical protein